MIQLQIWYDYERQQWVVIKYIYSSAELLLSISILQYLYGHYIYDTVLVA